MPKSNHKYRASVYLGKELYNTLSETSKDLNISISTLIKILIETGFQFATGIENTFKKGGVKSGKQ